MVKKEHGVSYAFCDREIKLAAHLYVMGNFKRNYDFETIPDRFKVMVDDKFQGDDFWVL